MSKVRLIVLSILAVFAVGAVASASASAAECKKEANGKFVLCLGEPLILTEGTLSLHVFTKTGTTYVLKSAGITVECGEILLTTEPTITGTSTGVTFHKIVLHFIKCKVATPAHCAVENELVKTVSLDGKAISKEVALFLPESGTEFATITFQSSGGTCLVAGKLKVKTEKGKTEEGPLCNTPEIEKTKAVHIIECTGGATSHLVLGEEVAEFKGAFNVELASGGLWAVIEGK